MEENREIDLCLYENLKYDGDDNVEFKIWWDCI